MNRLLPVLAFFPTLVFAGPTTYTFDVSAKDSVLSPIAGQVSFAFDGAKPRVVSDFGVFGSQVLYSDQSPFISPLAMPVDALYTVEANSIRTMVGGTVMTWLRAYGNSTTIDEHGRETNSVVSIESQFYSTEFPTLTAIDIARYFEHSEKFMFRRYSISYTNSPEQPYSNFVTHYHYVDQNAKLVSVVREAEIPEPGTIASLMLGLGFIFLRRRQ